MDDNYNIEMFYTEFSSDPRIRSNGGGDNNKCNHPGFVDIPKAEKEFKKIYNDVATKLAEIDWNTIYEEGVRLDRSDQ